MKMSQDSRFNLIANPMANAQQGQQGNPAPGSFIITGGMYGSGQERILVHTGGLPSAPPSAHQPQQQLSPVFILPPPAQPQPQPQPQIQQVRNMTLASNRPMKKASPVQSDEENGTSLPSFGGSFDCLSGNGNNGYKHSSTPLLSECPEKITRTPLPVIGGRCMADNGCVWATIGN